LNFLCLAFQKLKQQVCRFKFKNTFTSPKANLHKLISNIFNKFITNLFKC
jgi:hypothetical protein